MKKTLVLVMALGMAFTLSQCDIQKENKSVIVSGTIENPNTESLVISLTAFPEDIVLDTVFLNDDGSFYTSFELDKCSPANIYDGVESTKCYFCPGDSLYITVNTEEFDESIHYSGTGAEKNNLLAAYYLKFSDFANPEFVNFYSIKDTALNVYLELLSSVKGKAQDFFDQQNEQHTFPPEFVSFMQTRMYFTDIINSRYVFNRSNTDSTEAYMEMESETMEKILRAGEYPEPDPLSMEYMIWVRSALPTILSLKHQKEFSGDEYDRDFYDSVFYARLDQYLSPEELQMFYSFRIAGLARSYNYERMEAIRPLVDQYVTDTMVLADVNRKYADVREALNRDLPEDATLYNLDDEDLLDLTFADILAKYKGNVIYLDFWASWCGPCKDEMPNSAALSKKLKDEKVVFLYVSTDRDAGAWESMIKILQLHGLHYRLGKNTRKPVFEEFGIRFIPHYVLFDKEGNMVQNNMSRPSDPATEQKIREMLLEQ